MYRYSPEQQFDNYVHRDDMTMDERLHRWIDQELAAELERTVVVSNLPAKEDDLFNKLEEYLNKSANCAGYIERIEYLDDTSVIIVFFESKVSEDLVQFSTANVLDFHGARLQIKTLYEYEQTQEQDSGKSFKGSIFGQTTVNITNEWLFDVHQHYDTIIEMAANLGLQTSNSETDCSFTGNFDKLVKLRNKIEWLMFDERSVLVNPDEYMEIEPVAVSFPDVPSDHTLPDVPLNHTITAVSQQTDEVSPSENHEIMNYRPNKTEVTHALENGIEDSNGMEFFNKSEQLTRTVQFKPELVKYAICVHSAKIEEIKLTCYVNIRTGDGGSIKISLSDSVPGTETDVENAVDQLKLLFNEIDKEMSVEYLDLGKFDASDGFREMIYSKLRDVATVVVVRQPDTFVLNVYGKTDVIRDALLKAEDLLVKEVERETELKRELERKIEAERKEREAREVELREEARAREARRIEVLTREEMERREALEREAYRARIDRERNAGLEAVITPQTNSTVYARKDDSVASHDQPLPPPSTGDDWLEEPNITEHLVHVNGESSDAVDSHSNTTRPINSEQLETPHDLTNGRDDRNIQNGTSSPKQRQETSPNSTQRPLNARFHEFLSRNFFQSTSGSGAYMYDTIFNGVHITVKRGDIAKEPAAVIVSSNDVELSCGGAVSSTIDKNSGSIIHARCLEWMEAYGTPVEGQIVEIDSEGVLPCNKVFFLVMPTWSAEQDKMQLELQLRRSCKSILQKARDTRNVSSVAIPGLGTGKFYFPCDVYARIMTDALKDFLQAKGRMLEIRFIDLDFRVLQALQRELQSRLKHPEKASEYEQSLSEIYRQTTDNGEPLPTGFIESTPPSGFERSFRRQTSENHERERKWVKKFRSLSDTAGETRFESCVLCTRRVTFGFFGYIPCKHIICHLCSKGMELHEKRACPTCFKSFSKLQISKF